MFNNLVECAKTKKDSRTWTYLAATSAIWTLALAGSIVGGIFLYDAKLDEQLALLTRLVVPPPAPAAPKPMGTTTPKVNNNSSTVAPSTLTTLEPPKEIANTPTTHSTARSLVKIGSPGDIENPGGNNFGPDDGKSDNEWGLLPNDQISNLPEPKAPKEPKELKVAEPQVEKVIPQIIRKSEGVIRGITLSQVKPEYPMLARTSGVSGDVQVEVLIGEDGRVVSTKVVAGHTLLQRAALEAARQWKFNPTLLNGTPVKVQGILTFRFSL